MGSTFSFRCRECGYEASVSGGDDRGFVSFTTTIVCHTCRKLYDVLISKEDPDYVEILPKCPRSGKHIIERWTSPGNCPRCGGPMDQTGLGVLWD